MASRGVNKVILVGNLGNDPEHRVLPGGGGVTNISLATSESWKDKQTGQMNERTEWHRIVFFNRLSEIAAEYLRKGSKVYVEGSLRTRKWQDQSGADRYSTEVIANEMQMLDSRGSQGSQGGDNYGGGYGDSASGGYGGNQGGNNYSGNQGGGQSAGAPAQNQGFQPAPVGGSLADDDIPF